MNDDDINLQELAEAERDIQAFAAGEIELTPVDDPGEAAAIAAQLPPPDAPHNVIRPVRLPLDLDADVRALAARRGVSISAMLRDLIASGLEVTTGAAPDPVTELRRSLDAAQRAARELTAHRRDEAA
ncbi:CopG family transcriptional regulator [Dactylosporangium sp. CA-139066]|uniref:ribbon-helix-helix domain-containing protein n=1 Tax=Dactylosporangium sp. CA-139066 TaxID=3239930 RepID=UPI003D931EF4